VTFFDSDGTLVVRGRLPPEQGALLLKALEAAKDELLRQQRVSAETPPAGQQGGGACGCDEPHHEPAAAVSAETPAAAEEPAQQAAGPRSTGNQLLADALVQVASRSLAAQAEGAPSSDRFQVVVHIDAEVLADPLADGRCDLEGGPAIAPETVRRLACDCSVSSMAHGPHGELEAGRKSRVPSAALRRALRARDGTRCAFPGCSCQGKEAHHVEHWANGGATRLSNMLSLCKLHHSLVHEGGYSVEALGDGRFRFLRPDGRAVVEAPPLPAVTGEPGLLLSEQWLSPEVRITPSTGRPTWMGEACDYDWAVETLWLYDEAGPGQDPFAR
jgi:hypothetical protein